MNLTLWYFLLISTFSDKNADYTSSPPKEKDDYKGCPKNPYSIKLKEILLKSNIFLFSAPILCKELAMEQFLVSAARETCKKL